MGSRHGHQRRSDAPSWLTSPCPPWCTRAHHEDDHPEDRRHQDDGVVVPALLGRVEPRQLAYVAHAGELVVQRVRDLPASAPTWLIITESESAGGALVLSRESVGRLRAALRDKR